MVENSVLAGLAVKEAENIAIGIIFIKLYAETVIDHFQIGTVRLYNERIDICCI